MNVIKLDKWLLRLNENGNLVFPSDFEVEWITSGDRSSLALDNCTFHKGYILGTDQESTAALTICNQNILGTISKHGVLYFVEPLNETSGSHLIYKR